MSTTKIIKRAQKLVVTRDEAKSSAAKAHSELNECLQEAVLLAQTVADSMEIYRLSDNDNLLKIAWRKAVTLLGTSTKHLWDLALIRSYSHFSHQDAEFRKKEEIILSKINIEWLMSLDKKLPDQYHDMIQRKFGVELRTRFEQEARKPIRFRRR